MQTEQEYFSDAKVLRYCECCGEELYRDDEVLNDSNDIYTYFCSTDCALKYLGIERVYL
ncbi:TPA: hypothetical protein ACXNW8_001341 [Clostridium botulinum]|uniref:hypothetical protein n=1 Tax=Clostridium botulinum TaxID=1491 RepID=UPI001C9B4AF2|nr:hypothetical protein [Clostridium botulinum]MBY6909543.1 hypothetical protein [Clostridium botulinum]